MVKLELPRGMRDLDVDELSEISFIRDKFLETARLFNFKIMEPSPLETLATLEAKSGAEISKEIYAFKDKAGRDIALRFDLTIGLTRYVSVRRDLKMPAKIASFGGVWRYDEPQAARYRYFHQWDIEIYGPLSQESDAEVIEFVSSFFKRLGLKVTIEINDRQLIEEYINKKLGITAREEVVELFRAVDKVPKKGQKAVLQEYDGRFDPAKLKNLIELSGLKGTIEQVAKTHVKGLESWQKLADLIDSLSARNVPDMTINLGIVRGLDYYSGIVFEVFEQSGHGAALVGGGRYDTLTEAFGRKEIGATGAAGGVERIAMALRHQGIIGQRKMPLVYVAYTGVEQMAKARALTSELRDGGVAADYDLLGRPLRKQLEDASGKKARVAVIVAPDEIAHGIVILRSLDTGAEEKRPVGALLSGLSEALKA